MDISRLSTDLLIWVVRQYLTLEDEENFGLVCRAWRDIRDDPRMWTNVRLGTVFQKNNKLSRRPFRFFGVRSQGTEGHCCKVQYRGDRQVYAMKKARVYPRGEGVPYYMLREIEFLRQLNHPNVSMLKAVTLSSSELFMFFPYAPRTLHEALNSPPNEPHESGTPLPLHVTKRFLYQILKGVQACHERGVLHRNIKPKHILLYDNVDAQSSLYPVPASWEDDVKRTIAPKDLETCNVCLSDFALVRTSLQPLRRFTPEVVTLWYRAPEVLLGGQYFTSVDMWAVGCVFAEMLSGKPFFAGVCEINQLFEIFSKTGTPSEESWPGFARLPNYSMPFPNWPRTGLKRFFPKLDACALDLLEKILEVNPLQRLTARAALAHPFFDAAFLAREGISPEEHAKVSYLPPKDPQLSLASDERRIGMVHPRMLPFYLQNSLEVERDSAVFFKTERSAALPADFSRLRQQIVQKLVEVVEVYEMSPRTQCLAVSLMDRFLARKPSLIEKHRLVGTTCLHIASKCEDVSYVGVADLMTIPLGIANNDQSQSQKHVNELLELQEAVLNVLDFRLAVPTVLDFIQCFLHVLKLDQKTFFTELSATCQYFTELALLDMVSFDLLPSQLAVGVVVLSCLYFEPLVDAQLEELLIRSANCDFQIMRVAVGKLADAHAARRDTENQLLSRRYASQISVFKMSVSYDTYLRSRWTFFASRELPFSSAPSEELSFL